MLKDREAKDSAFWGLRALTCSGPHFITGTGVFSNSRCGHCYREGQKKELTKCIVIIAGAMPQKGGFAADLSRPPDFRCQMAYDSTHAWR